MVLHQRQVTCSIASASTSRSSIVGAPARSRWTYSLARVVRVTSKRVRLPQIVHRQRVVAVGEGIGTGSRLRASIEAVGVLAQHAAGAEFHEGALGGCGQPTLGVARGMATQGAVVDVLTPRLEDELGVEGSRRYIANRELSGGGGHERHVPRDAVGVL